MKPGLDRIILAASLLAASVPSTLGLAASQGPVSVDSCVAEGMRYGDGKGPSHISVGCFSALKREAPRGSLWTSSNHLERALGHRNLLFIHVYAEVATRGRSAWVLSRERIIAGSETGLRDIRAIAVDERHREIAVIDGASGRVSVFSLEQAGNVAPIRTYDGTAVSGATALAFESDRERLWVAVPGQGELVAFDRAERDPKPAHRLSLKAAGIRQVSALLVVPARAGGDELLVADPASNAVVALAPQAPYESRELRRLQGYRTGLGAPSSLTYLGRADQIAVGNADGRVLRFRHGAQGDTEPLKEVRKKTTGRSRL